LQANQVVVSLVSFVEMQILDAAAVFGKIQLQIWSSYYVGKNSGSGVHFEGIEFKLLLVPQKLAIKLIWLTKRMEMKYTNPSATTSWE